MEPAVLEPDVNTDVVKIRSVEATATRLAKSTSAGESSCRHKDEFIFPEATRKERLKDR